MWDEYLKNQLDKYVMFCLFEGCDWEEWRKEEKQKEDMKINLELWKVSMKKNKFALIFGVK